MFCTDCAALSGRVTMKKISNAIAMNPTIFLTFTRTTVLRWRGPLTPHVMLPRLFVQHPDGAGYPARGAVPSPIVTESETVTPCVGGLAYDADGRLLLVRRGNEPGRGRWSVPGGRVEAGEDDAAALVREMREETGLTVRPGRLVGRVSRGRYAVADYACTVVGGELQAGDDALDARWCTAADLAGLPLVDELVETLAAWDALPR